MKTEIKFIFDETEDYARDIVINSRELHSECLEFEQALRNRYKHSNFETTKELEIVEEIIDKFRETIGSVMAQVG